MSEEEKFNSIIQEIKDIYLYLTKGEPSPDDEITARKKLINQIQTLKSTKTINAEANMALFNDTLNKLDNWDTLELWFIESELPENIEEIIKITDTLPELETQVAIKETPPNRRHKDLEPASSDIDQIVNKVSEKFKGEIDALKHKIDTLKLELELKDEALQHVSQNRVIKKITPKKNIKLPPPKIKLPIIKKPDHIPKIKAPSKLEAEKPKRAIGIKSIRQVKTKIEQGLEKQTKASNFEQKPEIEEVAQKTHETKFISDIPKDLELISDIFEESEYTQPLESPNFTRLPEKPKKRTLETEIIEVEISEEEKKIPFTLKESEIDEDQIIKEPEINEKPTIVKKPKITSLSIEEIEAEEIRSTGTELFNVFSSVGEKSTERLTTSDEVVIFPPTKKKKKEEKTDAKSFVGFKKTDSETNNYSEPETEIEEELPSDKDSLYQELIALEGKRYSLEKNFKELEKIYSTGSINDSEHNKQSDDLRTRLNSITSKINKIRRLISSL